VLSSCSLIACLTYSCSCVSIVSGVAENTIYRVLLHGFDSLLGYIEELILIVCLGRINTWLGSLLLQSLLGDLWVVAIKNSIVSGHLELTNLIFDLNNTSFHFHDFLLPGFQVGLIVTFEWDLVLNMDKRVLTLFSSNSDF
jgi:hypothetical protein